MVCRAETTPVTQKALIIGYGNTLRGDDAVGQAAAQALAGEAAIAGAETIACHQLTPELAERIAACGSGRLHRRRG